MSNEQLGKLSRHRAISEQRRTFNAGPCSGLSLLSRGIDACKLAFVCNLGSGLFGSDDKLTLGLDPGCALILPVADEPAGREGQQEERDG